MGRLGHQKLPWNFYFSCLCREIAQKPALFFYEEELRKLLGFSLQDFDPLFQLGNKIMKLHGSRNTEVKIFKIKQKQFQSSGLSVNSLQKHAQKPPR